MNWFLWFVALAMILVSCGGPSDSAELSPTTATLVESTTPSIVKPTGMRVAEQIPGLSVWALVEGNDLDADRINLVFAPWGWGDEADFVDFVAGSLSWSGDAFLYDDLGGLVEDPQAAFDAGLGLFAIEPWRSNRDSFNVWYTDIEPETPVAWLNEGKGDDPFDLPDQLIVTIALDAYRFNPELTSVAGQNTVFEGPGDPQRPVSDDPFSNVVIVIESVFPADGLGHMPHEIAHAMYNLPDEYVGDQLGYDERTDLSSWPSCAESMDEAGDWWGELTGDIDPMVRIWADEMAEAGFPFADPNVLARDVEVGAVNGGCYGVEGSFRATQDSLMNRNIPVLGSVNRRWAEQILNLWASSPRG